MKEKANSSDFFEFEMERKATETTSNISQTFRSGNRQQTNCSA